MSNYSRGASFERKVASDLEAFGYVTVRSAGSHSPADVLATRRSLLGVVYGVAEVVAVQCKTNGRLDPDEWNEFWEWCAKGGALPILAQRGANHRGTVYHLITGRKTGAGRQPWVPWEPRKEES